MADNSSDSDLDALFQKITNKLSKQAQRSARKKKTLKGKVSQEKENVPVKNVYKMAMQSESVKNEGNPLKSAQAHTNLHKLVSGHTKKQSSRKTKTTENRKQCLFKSLKPSESTSDKATVENGKQCLLKSLKLNESSCDRPKVENGNPCLFKSLKPSENISNRPRQSCMSECSILYSDASFLDDIGVPLIESTRIHSRESISAMNLGDNTFFSAVSKHSKHFTDETAECVSYEQLNILQNDNFETKSTNLKHVLSSPDTDRSGESTSQGIGGNGKRLSTNKSEKVVTVISESEDDACNEKFYSVLEERSSRVHDSSGKMGFKSVEQSSSDSSYEVEDTSVQTDEVFQDLGLNGSVKNACNSDRDFKTQNISNDEEVSFVEVVDTSMQTENYVKNENSAEKKSVEEMFDNMINLKATVGTNKKRFKKVTAMPDTSSNNHAMTDNSPTACQTVLDESSSTESSGQESHVSNSDSSLPNLDEVSFKTCASTILSQSDVAEEDQDVLELTNKVKEMGGKPHSTCCNVLSLNTENDLELTHNSSVITAANKAGLMTSDRRVMNSNSNDPVSAGQVGIRTSHSQKSDKTNADDEIGGSWRSKQEISESSEDEDLEEIFQKIRSSSSKLKHDSPSADRTSESGDSMEAFIVNDCDVSSGEEDECFYITALQTTSSTFSRKPPALRTNNGKFIRQMKNSQTNEPCFSSSDSDNELFLPAKFTPRVKKSVADEMKKLLFDSDDEDLPQPVSSHTSGITKLVKTSAVKPKKELPGKDSCVTKQNDPEVYSFLRSLTSDSVTEHRRHPDAIRYVKNLKKHKDELTRRLFCLFNDTVFENQLPSCFEIEWNKRLLRTAGYCSYKKGYTAKIELSTKVCDSAERVRDTLIHELCHAAVWVVNHTKDGHGPYWKYWARKANKSHPEIPVISRCHNYSINTKYTYECTQCGYSIGRHSKSLDTDNKVCGHCRGRFEVRLTSQSNSTSSGLATPKTPRTPNKFALFVKDNYGDLKKKSQELTHKDIMQTLSREFAEKNRINNRF